MAVEVDEALFLGRWEKGPFLREIEPDFFSDNQTSHCNSGTPTGHARSGVANAAARPRKKVETVSLRQRTGPAPLEHPFGGPCLAGNGFGQGRESVCASHDFGA